jgi:guanine deaminase
VPVSLGCDVGGGTSLSMLRTMADAYKVQAMAGRRVTAWKCLYAATLGAARALRLAHEVGSFALGTLADLAVWDWAAGPVAQRRHEVARDLHDRLFSWITLADERNLAATYVAGRRRYDRTVSPTA